MATSIRGQSLQSTESVRRYTERRVRRWLMRRTGQRGTGFARIPDKYLYETLGLYAVRLDVPTCRERRLDGTGESRMREICTSGLTSGMWKRGMVRILRHRQPKGPETDRPSLNHRATSRLYRSPSGRHRRNASGHASARARSASPPPFRSSQTANAVSSPSTYADHPAVAWRAPGGRSAGSAGLPRISSSMA